MGDLATALARGEHWLKGKAADARGKLPMVGGDTGAVTKLDEQAKLLGDLARAIRAAND